MNFLIYSTTLIGSFSIGFSLTCDDSRECADTTISTTETVICSGDYACYRSNLNIPVAYCNGNGGCNSINIVTRIEPWNYLHCDGAFGCYSGDILSMKTIYANGFEGVAYTDINNGGGYFTNIYCTNGSSCNVYCDGSSCQHTALFCYDNSTCISECPLGVPCDVATIYQVTITNSILSNNINNIENENIIYITEDKANKIINQRKMIKNEETKKFKELQNKYGEQEATDKFLNWLNARIFKRVTDTNDESVEPIKIIPIVEPILSFDSSYNKIIESFICVLIGMLIGGYSVKSFLFNNDSSYEKLY